MAYEVVIVTLCIVFMVIKGAYFHQTNPNIFWLSIFGAFINFFVICIMVLAIARHNTLKEVCDDARPLPCQNQNRQAPR